MSELLEDKDDDIFRKFRNKLHTGLPKYLKRLLNFPGISNPITMSEIAELFSSNK